MKKIKRSLRAVVVGFMLAACVVMGIVFVMPKRKEQYNIEVEIEDKEEKEGIDEAFVYKE